MLRICCCCFSGENDDSSERQPLLHPNPDGCESARSSHSGHRGAHSVNGEMVVKRVGVQELDQRFSDVAEIFNTQREHYETMVRRIRNVRQIYGCNSNDTLELNECLMKIRDEHEAHYRVFLKLNGYDFSLSVVPRGSAGGLTEEPLPPHLRLAQAEFKDASDSVKATISKGTPIQEWIGWLLRSTDQMAEQVKGAAATYQEQRRLSDNLERNVKEVRRAKDLSQAYRQRATEVLSEVAELAGTIS